MSTPLTPEEEAWQRGFEEGRATVMVAWKFTPVPGKGPWGDILYATTDQVDADLMQHLGEVIAEKIRRTAQEATT